ncbi:SH2 domain protein [Ancylostoma ceylanicum]|uniref:Tyrosine-protein kinase n=1 Tax=Ancylostoma ceylanicum TaxID=53326 RepID=A0A0D6L5V1_9BILA|nr:SH2 domain protein [Ancylostoma ceylanicum]
MRYQCHINVGCCCSIIAFKYIFKYIYKGPDQVIFELLHNQGVSKQPSHNGADHNPAIDVYMRKAYLDGRFISQIVAAERLLAFPIQYSMHTIARKMANNKIEDKEYYHGMLQRRAIHICGGISIKSGRPGVHTMNKNTAQVSRMAVTPLTHALQLPLVSVRVGPGEDMRELFTEGGDYLVRMGMTKKGEAKSFIVSLSLSTKKTQVKHFVISRNQQGFSVDNVNYFPDIVQLIDYYASNETILKRPISRASWELCHDQVVLGKKIGEGQFGSVVEGKLNLNNRPPIDVAVKMSKEEHMDFEQVKELLKEARIMRCIIHPNIVIMYGVAVDKEPVLIVMELMKKGELRKFLLKKKSTPKQKLNWIAQAAYGLAYLHSSNFIHRDIAARNCLLTDHNVLKLADFGLTREGDIYHMATTRKLPIKWIPPEVILNNTFSFKSDVWSFGILAWEIMSNGAIPYQGLPNVKVKEMILKGEMNKFPPESNAEGCQSDASCVRTAHASGQHLQVERESVLELLAMLPCQIKIKINTT